MRAMRLAAARTRLSLEEALPTPQPGAHQVLLRVTACGVCRTDLHIVDGELTQPKLPLIPGHEIVGTVAALGDGVTGLKRGDRIGVPWLGFTCGRCVYCRSGRENLCDHARFTGYNIDGGYADHAVADTRFCFLLPSRLDDVAAAPLLCAGLIGYRALRLAGAAERLGIYGFGAAAHIVAQVARHRGQRVFAFTLGAEWAGGSSEAPPAQLDAALIFAPVGALVPAALAATAKGGTVVCAGIHMSDIPRFAYRLLWEERIIRSVANLTRQDGEEFLALAPTIPVRTTTQPYPLAQANEALDDLREGRLTGAAVLVP
jgi:alcohol dehydrogenase, propanol-preferring